MSPDPPGIPQRHRREPDLEAERLDRAAEHIPRQPPVAIREPRPSLGPQAKLEELGIKRWQIIAGIVAVLGGMVTTCTTAAVTIATATRPADPRIDQVIAKVDAIEAKLELAGSSDATTRIGLLERNVEFLAEGQTKLNGQPFNDGFPRPKEGSFSQDPLPEPVPLPKFKSTRQWATKPE